MKVVVVGGGISGLATAYYVRQRAAEVGSDLCCTVVEGTSRFGGKIFTRQIDEFITEGGPDSFLTRKPQALALCQELGLSNRLLPVRPTNGGTQVLHRGQLVPLPEGMALVTPTRPWPFVRTPLLSWRGKLRAALDLVIRPRTCLDDESVAAFLRRRLGSEFLDAIAEPLLGGIHAGDPERLSVQALFPHLVELERQYGSLIRGTRARSRETPQPEPILRTAALQGAASAGRLSPPPAFVSLSGGMGELVEALIRRLDPARLIRGRRAIRIDPVAGGTCFPRYRVTLEDGQHLEADAVVLATPAHVSADLVESIAPSASSALHQIRYASTVVMSLGYRRADALDRLEEIEHGHGFVVPRREGRAINACTWLSSKFEGRAPSDHALLRVFLGGARAEHLVDLDDERLLQLVRFELRRILGITTSPVLVDIVRWPRGIPQYDVGHRKLIATIERNLAPGLFLTGAAYHGVGVPDCIQWARTAAQASVDYVITRGVRPSEPSASEGALS